MDKMEKAKQKECHGQDAESQVGTRKGKLTNTKLHAGSQPGISHYPKTKTARTQSLQISSWAEA